MQKQDYQHHIRYYPPHHYFFYPVSLLLTIGSAWLTFREEQKLIWAAITLAFFMIMVLSVLLRQHYALDNQNRIVRLEMRLRYYQLTGKRFEPIEAQLSFGQIAALRFASDEELPALTDRAVKEQLSADNIKKVITNWQPDHMRV